MIAADYSGGYPSPAALKAAGVTAVLRYAVSDFPRGFTSEEYHSLTDAGIAFGFVHEGRADRMRDGYDAGCYDTENAAKIVRDRTGLTDSFTLYSAADFDATVQDQVAIDSYLVGSASLIGLSHTGLYGGYWPLLRAYENATASYFWQTVAWSGYDFVNGEFVNGLLLPQANLIQNRYGVVIDDVSCDLNTVFTEVDFGQVRTPPVVVTPTYPAPSLPDWYADNNMRRNPSIARWNIDKWYPIRANVQALRDTVPHVAPDESTAASGPHIPAGRKIAVDWHFKRQTNGTEWFVNESGYWRASAFATRIPFPLSRG